MWVLSRPAGRELALPFSLSSPRSPILQLHVVFVQTLRGRENEGACL